MRGAARGPVTAPTIASLVSRTFVLPASRRRAVGGVQPLEDHALHPDRRPRQPLAHDVGLGGRRAQRPQRRQSAGRRTRTPTRPRRRYGQEVVSVPDSLSRSNATKWAGHSSAVRAAPAARRASRFCNRSNARRPAASHTTSSPSSAVASGSCTAPAPISGNAGSISVPRLERSITWPASTESRALKPSYFGSPADPGSSAGSDTGAASIGSGSVHVTAHAFHPAARRQTECANAPDYRPDHGRSAHYNTSPGAVC